MNLKLGALSPFAHLGRGAAAAKPAVSEAEKPDPVTVTGNDAELVAQTAAAITAAAAAAKKKADDEEAAKTEAEEDEKAKKTKTKKDKAKKDDDTNDEDDGDEPDDDDEGDRRDDTKSKARAARGRERGRIRAILTSAAGKQNPVAAAELATGTSMPRQQAVAMLMAIGPAAEAAPAPAARDALRERMAKVDVPNVGASDDKPNPNLAQQIVLAGKKARGEAA